jgi:hypothetical protein
MSLRRTIIALAASGGLAMSGLAMSTAAARADATVYYGIQTAINGKAWAIGEYPCDRTGYKCEIRLNTGATLSTVSYRGKWVEIQDAYTHYCLELYGRAPDYKIQEDSCRHRSSELWWFAFDRGDDDATFELINNYGSSALKHNACMWTNGRKNDWVTVQRCVSGQSTNQQWRYLISQ